MDRKDEPPDPFAGLEGWARATERRVRRETRRTRRAARASGPPGPLRSALLVAAVAIGAVVLAAALPGFHSFLPFGSPASGAPVSSPTAVVSSGSPTPAVVPCGGCSAPRPPAPSRLGSSRPGSPTPR